MEGDHIGEVVNLHKNITNKDTTNRIKLMTSIPESFKPISVPLPPMLLSMAGVEGDSRFIALKYWGNKAAWNDGRGSATFPFYTVWKPYIEHLAIAIHLFDTHLGSDDYEPTHVLVCDRQHEKVYVAPIEEAMRFLDSQHPPRQPITLEQWEEIKAQLGEQAPLDMSQLQDLGLFEVFLPSKPEHKEVALQLVQWLDGYIDEALISSYIDAAKAGNHQAIWVLETFKSRCR